MNKLLRKVITTTIIGSMLVLTACGSKAENTVAQKAAESKGSESGEKLEKVRFGTDASTFSIQFRIAQSKDIFKKYGIDPEVQTFSFGIDTLNAATLDQVDTAQAMDFAVANRLSKGNLKVLSLINTPKPTNGELLVKDNIKKPEDLKGKKIGVGKGTVNEYIWAKILDKYKIDKNDVKIEYLQSGPEILAALDRGDVEAVAIEGSNRDKAKKLPGIKSLGDYSLIDFRMRGYFVVQDKLIKERPKVAANILKALDEATDYIKKNPEEVAEFAFKELKIPKESVLKEIKDNWDFDVKFSKEDFDHINNVYTWSYNNGLIKDKYELKDRIVIDPLKEALPNKEIYKP